MPLDRARVGLALAAVALVFGLLALVAWEFMRDAIVAPVYFLLRACLRLLEGLPYEGYMALLAVILVAISLDTMQRIRSGRPDEQHDDELPQTDSRYLQWRRLYENQQYNWFLRNKFALEVRHFLLSLLAFQAEKDAAEVEAMIKDGSLPVPDSIQYLIQHQTIRPAESQTPIAPGTDDPLLDEQVAEIVRFIEHCLEINHVGNRSSS
jgi:hypothetical protein